MPGLPGLRRLEGTAAQRRAGSHAPTQRACSPLRSKCPCEMPTPLIAYWLDMVWGQFGQVQRHPYWRQPKPTTEQS